MSMWQRRRSYCTISAISFVFKRQTYADVMGFSSAKEASEVIAVELTMFGTADSS